MTNNSKRPAGSSSRNEPSYKQHPQEQEKLGDILRRVREHRGETIKEIAEYLCIRANYLEALEDSYYERLPADAYVIGFLKTYASYLELDEKGAVNQYRHEMAGRRRKPQLTMPQPMSEGRAPTLSFMGGGALAALLLYGVWYGLWAPDRAITESPLEIPAPVIEMSLSSEEDNIQESSVFLETATLPKIAAIDTIIIEAEPPQKTKPVEEKKEPISPPKKPTMTKANATKANGANSSEAKPVIKIFGAKKKSYITLKAEEDSWVLITDSKGLTVFDLTLLKGESYRVPTKSGLRLTTGNPRNIGISIFGKKMPKIKSKSKVARGITLNPSKLKKLLTKENDDD